MKHFAIIADDLTGASDSGVQFARKGIETQVIFDLERFSAGGTQVDAVVIDTDSRAVNSQTAYDHVKEAAQQISRSGFQHVYKKMDSTLRGNLGVELDAIMDEIPFDFAVVAPAFPKIGRTTLHGIHSLHGVPIHLTEIGNDPKRPVKESDLIKLFGTQSKRKVGLIALDTLRQEAEQVIASIEALRHEQVEVIVFDAVEEDDMRKIALTLASTPYRILWAGSAGLADYLPEALRLPIRAKEDTASLPESGKPVFLVAGSISKVTREQVAVFNQDPLVVAVEFNTVKGVGSEEGALEEMARCRAALKAAFSEGRDASLYASSSQEDVRLSVEAGAQRGFDATQVSNYIAKLLGQVASGLIQDTGLQGVILTGGDTAKAVSKELGVSGIQLIKEVEPGIPLGKLIGDTPLLVVTKAGAFGSENSLVQAKTILKGGQSNE